MGISQISQLGGDCLEPCGPLNCLECSSQAICDLIRSKQGCEVEAQIFGLVTRTPPGGCSPGACETLNRLYLLTVDVIPPDYCDAKTIELPFIFQCLGPNPFGDLAFILNASFGCEFGVPVVRLNLTGPLTLFAAFGAVSQSLLNQFLAGQLVELPLTGAQFDGCIDPGSLPRATLQLLC